MMLFEIRQNSLRRIPGPPRVEPQGPTLIQSVLSSAFQLEHFGFAFGYDGRIRGTSYRLRPSLPYGMGTNYTTDWQVCFRRNRNHGLNDVFCYEAICRCPFSADVSVPFAFVCRETKGGPVHFWSRFNTGYSLYFDQSEQIWRAEFSEPLFGAPPAADMRLAGFRFDEISHRLVGGNVYAAEAAGGLLQLRCAVGRPSVVLDESIYSVGDGFALQLYDDFFFQKLAGQDRVLLQRGPYFSCFETQYLFCGDTETSPWGRFYCRRSPVWKAERFDAEQFMSGRIAGPENSHAHGDESPSFLRKVICWFSGRSF